MKKTAFVTILSATLLFTSCSSGQSPATSAATEPTTAATTEAATASTAETTALSDKPEEYADIKYYNIDDPNAPIASDFDFVDAALYKDVNGVMRYPNYQAGKDIVVTFKCEKDLKYGYIFQWPKEDEDDGDSIAEESSAPNDEKSILKYLTNKDGVYSLKIPAKYANPDTGFTIHLYTVYPMFEYDNDGNEKALGYGMSFFIRCEKVTEVPVPNYDATYHAVYFNAVEATDFEWGNPELIVTNDKHSYSSKPPKYKAGEDIVISFKCKRKLKLDKILVYTSNDNEGIDIADSKYVTCKNETYTLTIPAEQAQSGREYSVFFSYNNKDNTDNRELVFRIAC